MKNFKMTVSYDGTRYFGWEHQPNTDMTIQGKLESVLTQLVENTLGTKPDKTVTVIGAGRTDFELLECRIQEQTGFHHKTKLLYIL